MIPGVLFTPANRLLQRPPACNSVQCWRASAHGSAARALGPCGGRRANPRHGCIGSGFCEPLLVWKQCYACQKGTQFCLPSLRIEPHYTNVINN
jgi:hypothetical protein